MARHVLNNATLWIGDGGELHGHVVIDGERIAAVAAGPYTGDLPTTDLKGLALSPGLIDVMVLGGFNRTILRDGPLDIAREYLHLGVTSCQFCGGMVPREGRREIAAKVRAAAAEDSDASRVLGFYAEGPFQQPEFTGAGARQFALPPTEENVAELLEDMGDVLRMVNVSPGTPGDAAAVRRLCAAGKVVAMAHSDAAAERVLACVDAGTTVLGHIWDNNPARIGDSGVQQPTVDHIALTDERIRYIHLICDGTHAAPAMVNIVVRCRGAEAICLVTDAVSRAGRPDGPYYWDDGRQFYKRGGVGRTETGWLAGSALLLPDHLRNFIKFTGLPRREAIRTVTANPAASLGLEDRIGLLASGRYADLVAWDDRLRVRHIWCGGRPVPDVVADGEIELAT